MIAQCASVAEDFPSERVSGIRVGVVQSSDIDSKGWSGKGLFADCPLRESSTTSVSRTMEVEFVFMGCSARLVHFQFTF